MKSSYELYEPETYVETSGGESYLEGCDLDEYDIHIGDFSINGIKGEDFCKLAVLMVNHARLNGRKFVFCSDHSSQDQPIKLQYRGK
jgi:hypothetical protein